MPNWCNNGFSITGSTESIKELWETAQTADNGEFGLLNAIMPMPKELEGTDGLSSDGNDWYSWRVNNWGTKWDVSDEGLEFIDNGDGTASISGWFDSAWAPPIAAYEQLAADFDSCIIECSYYEPGMDFGGFWSSENGDEEFDNLQERLEQPTEEWDERFTAFEAEYDLLSEEWRFEDDEEEVVE
jgi:hypothetical protein